MLKYSKITVFSNLVQTSKSELGWSVTFAYWYFTKIKVSVDDQNILNIIALRVLLPEIPVSNPSYLIEDDFRGQYI